ncbi:MAG: hypothetical protein ACK4NF_03360 [Planctomycetota bacterium]
MNNNQQARNNLINKVIRTISVGGAVFVSIYAGYLLLLYYKKIYNFAVKRYNLNLITYQNKLKEIFTNIKNASIYIKSVEKIEVIDIDTATVKLQKRRIIFNVTDGTKVCAVSDDNKIISNSLRKENIPLFFYPYPLLCEIFENIEEKLFSQYKTIAMNWMLFPTLQKVSLVYLKPSYDGFHIYLWLRSSVRLYGGFHFSLTRSLVQEIENKLAKLAMLEDYLKDFPVVEIDLSYKKFLVKLE